MLVKVGFITAITFVPVVFIVGRPVVGIIVLVSGGNCFAFFNQRVAIVAVCVACVAVFEFGCRLGVFDNGVACVIFRINTCELFVTNCAD